MELFIAILAVYGAASLLNSYDGPSNVFRRIRCLAIGTMFEDVLGCVVCSSCWLAIIPAFILPYIYSAKSVSAAIVLAPIYWIAIVGAIIAIQHLSE